jgi:hypothetical protein
MSLLEVNKSGSSEGMDSDELESQRHESDLEQIGWLQNWLCYDHIKHDFLFTAIVLCMLWAPNFQHRLLSTPCLFDKKFDCK